MNPADAAILVALGISVILPLILYVLIMGTYYFGHWWYFKRRGHQTTIIDIPSNKED